MEVNKHIGFSVSDDLELYEYLCSIKIPMNKTNDLVVFDILESNPHWSHISSHLESHHLFCLSDTIFSKQELADAEWLSMRSKWHFGYPQPEDAFKYEAITYIKDRICKTCSRDLVQQDAFRLKKTPNWGKRHFGEVFWVEDEMFLRDEVVDIFKKENISGIFFGVVKNKTGKETLLNINQLIIPYILDEGIDEKQTLLKKISVCAQCGRKKYLHSGIGPLVFNKKVFVNAPDIVKTGEVFGDGHFASRYILIRQKVYQTIIKYHLERGLEFSPLVLV